MYAFEHREEKILERASKLKVTAGLESTADIGPVISKQVYGNFGDNCESDWKVFILYACENVLVR
jgi:acyl-CoA reductase-like NAD-dependent aldehyde dehydrogenase